MAPNLAEAHKNLGTLLASTGDAQGAIEAFGRALDIAPNDAPVAAQKMHQEALISDWGTRGSEPPDLSRLDGSGSAVPPFTLLAAEDCPERQLERAQRWAAQVIAPQTPPFAACAKAHREKLRIGYFSANLHNHPVLSLISGLFRSHDRDHVEAFAYSYGQRRDGTLRAQALDALDHVHDVGGQSDGDLVALARAHKLDVAIDLMGYTQDARTVVFKARVAPVQVNYLGYPGTMGAAFMDYMIADTITVPPQERAHYAETMIFLPDCFQPNDDRRPVADQTPSRVSEGLPDQGFVFCAFNNFYKIGPDAFDMWMRILQQVERSVLWLQAARTPVQNALRAEAKARGVDPTRLIFARTHQSHADHLARYRCADLFLDTFVYGAHTTASDALWAGLPVITKPGRQFTARVAASVLHAVGLPDLVANSLNAYENLAVTLAHDPDRLAQYRSHLAAHRTTSALFDTSAYTRNFEAGLRMAHDACRAGLPPQDIYVTG